MATVADLLEELDELGFDVPEAQQIRWIDRRHKKMVARARALKKRASVGVTVAGQAVYPVDLVELEELTVNDVPFAAGAPGDAYAYAQGRLRVSGDGGLYVEDASGAGVRSLTLIPTPETAGLSIVAYGAFRAPTLDDAGDTLLVDDEFLDGLVEGAMATGYARDAERFAEADRFEARFDAACKEFEVDVRRRYAGSGVAQIRVQGVNR